MSHVVFSPRKRSMYLVKNLIVTSTGFMDAILLIICIVCVTIVCDVVNPAHRPAS